VRNQRWQGQASPARLQPSDVRETIPQDVAASLERTERSSPCVTTSSTRSLAAHSAKVDGGRRFSRFEVVQSKSPQRQPQGEIRMRILEHIKARANGLPEANGNKVSEGSTGCADGPARRPAATSASRSRRGPEDQGCSQCRLTTSWPCRSGASWWSAKGGCGPAPAVGSPQRWVIPRCSTAELFTCRDGPPARSTTLTICC
jgi:hypothetical protein